MVTSVSHKRVVGYIRVSTEKQIGDGHISLETQESRIRDSVVARGDSLIEIFRDVQSGRRDDRPEYLRMIRYVTEHDVDVVLVQYLDRFGRDAEEILKRIWQLKEQGVSVEATDQDIADQFMLMINAGLASHESKRISERVRANMDNIVKSGTHSGKPPYGFRSVKEIVDGRARVVRWEHDESEVEILKEMIRLCVAENMGFKAIADNLNERGMTRPGGHWVPSSIQHILRNPVLKGVMAYGRKPKTGNPKRHVVEVSGVMPPVLSEDEWDALQLRMDIRRGAPRGPVHKSSYLLTSIARCGHCGGPMVGKAGSSWKGKRYRNYTCVRANTARVECQVYNGHAAKRLEAAVLEYLGRFSDPKLVKKMLAGGTASRIKAQKRELAKLEKKLAALDSDFHKNLDLLKKGLLNEEEFGKANERRRDERAATESRLAELREESEAAESAKESAAALPHRIKSFLQLMEELEPPKAKAILQTILKASYIWREGRIELEFR